MKTIAMTLLLLCFTMSISWQVQSHYVPRNGYGYKPFYNRRVMHLPRPTYYIVYYFVPVLKPPLSTTTKKPVTVARVPDSNKPTKITTFPYIPTPNPVTMMFDDGVSGDHNSGRGDSDPITVN